MNKIFKIIIIILVILYVFRCDLFESFSVVKSEEIPTVKFPFKNLFDDMGNKLNIILISAPFRENEHMKQYLEYKAKGLDFCGISSYLNFPDRIDNPYEDNFHKEKNHDYVKMVSAWLYCSKEEPHALRKSTIPRILLTEADLKNINNFKPVLESEKEYDFIYICLKDNDKCEPGWQSYNRNWKLAKKCLKIMCGKFGLKGIIVGRTNCKFTDLCKEYITVIPMLSYDKFQENNKS